MIHKPVMSNFKVDTLTDENLRAEAPCAFATEPMPGLSSRYTFVPTAEIVAGLREKHWVPVSAEQQRVRAAKRLGFQKHVIRFRREEQLRSLDEWNEELVLTNSHDAGCAYIMRIGIFRRVCSNGLVVSDETFEAIRFRHANLRAEEVVEASYRILEQVPKLAWLIEDFRKRTMTDAEALTFAERALLMRFEPIEDAPIEPRTLLTVRRPEDGANNLWTILNRIQENLLRGGLSDNRRSRAGHLRSLRSIRGIDSKLSLNTGLWNIAQAMHQATN